MDIPTTDANKISNGKILIKLLAIFVVLAAIFYGKDVVTRYFNPESSVDEVIRLSTDAVDQKPIQDFLIKQIKEGKNDSATQSALFWITHRFFDNGGNIYEIYDFINAHPEVAFLNDAEKIYPDAFQIVKARKATAYDTPSTLALLGYFEVADAHKYSNFAMLGLATNKYAELAYIFRGKINAKTSKADSAYYKKISNQFLGRSRSFSAEMNKEIDEKTKVTGALTDITNAGFRDDDLLVGLNQFANAQFFYRGMGGTPFTKFTPEEIFAFNVKFARIKVPRLYFFTNYLWATAEVNAHTVNAMTVSIPLNNVIEYGKANNKNIRPAGSLLRVINSNKNGEKSVFSRANTVALANGYKPFKDWLLSVGWVDADFK